MHHGYPISKSAIKLHTWLSVQYGAAQTNHVYDIRMFIQDWDAFPQQLFEVVCFLEMRRCLNAHAACNKQTTVENNLLYQRVVEHSQGIV